MDTIKPVTEQAQVSFVAVQSEAIEFYRKTLREEADQLDRWAQESIEGGWSTHQVEPMRKRADELRRIAR